MPKKIVTVETVETSIARWQTRLRRAVNAIAKLEASKKRLTKKLAKPPVEPPPIPASTLVAAVKGHIARVKVTSHPVANPDNVKLTFEPVEADAHLDIPEFLRRGQAAQKAADKVIADQIRQEQAATKKAKAQGRIATMKAKKAGDLKKMPLTGKAALAAIRGG